MIKAKYFILNIALILVMSCAKDNNDSKQEEHKNNLLSKSEIGIYGTSKTICSYNEQEYQLVSYSDGSMFVMTNMEQSKFFSVSFTEQLIVGKIVGVKVETLGLDGVSSGDFRIEVLRVTDDKVWLWDATNERGYVVRHSRKIQ